MNTSASGMSINASLRKVGEVPFFKNLEVHPDSPDAKYEAENVAGVFAAMENLMQTPTLVAGSVMPDACPTGEATIPVGGVVAAENAIHPGFHSADICCSVMATSLGKDVDCEQVISAANSVTHFGGGGRKRSSGVFKQLETSLAQRIRDNGLFTEADFKKAQMHLGTQGDGNHFLFVGKRESDGQTMMVTHHGSRGFGAALYQTGMEIAERFRQQLSPETPTANAWIPAGTPEGEQYWEALQIVRDWTRLNHEVIHRLTAAKVGIRATEIGVAKSDRTFWNEHNFVFKKSHANSPSNDSSNDSSKATFYHAKGATQLDDAFVPDSHQGLRLVPLNMGQPVLIVRGETNATNLGFAPHGAGRNMSRTRHKELRRETGLSDTEIFHAETQGLDVRFFSDTIDISELPSAYKNADEVQRQMTKFGLGEVVDRIQPFGCIMAGSGKRRNR